MGPRSPKRNLGHYDPEWTDGDHAADLNHSSARKRVECALDKLPSWAGQLQSTPFGAESRENYRKGIRENQPAPAMPWTFATCRAERPTTRPPEATGLKLPAGA